MLKPVINLFVMLVTVVLVTAGCVSPPENTLSQVSTIDALLAGVYDGEITLGQLTARGDTGIGTFDSLDGEMIVLNGKVYQVKADGRIYTPPPDITTPFAAVINFRPETRLITGSGLDYPALTRFLDRAAPHRNLFYAFRITGRFAAVRTRSVPRQQQPFPPLAQVVKTQPVFNLKNVSGTVVGFRCPAYVKGINVPGYHLHFITADRRRGGHMLGFRMLPGAVVEIDCSNKFFLVLPESRPGFDRADLNADRSRELHQAEQ
ncbi:MAG: acetolactate decarboxylase [Victivallaceae bacterium]|nr:acetolactate decarboxylase [Victivallaceae bacterium]